MNLAYRFHPGTDREAYQGLEGVIDMLMDFGTLLRGKSEISLTTGDLSGELRERLVQDLFARSCDWSNHGDDTRFKLLYKMVVKDHAKGEYPRVVDILTWSIASLDPTTFYIDEELYVTLAETIGVLPYSWAFKRGEMFEDEHLSKPASQIVALCLHLSTDARKGWDRLDDQEFMEGLLSCRCMNQRKNILEYLVTVDRDKGIAVEITVELDDASALPYDQADEHGMMLREAKSHRVVSREGFKLDSELSLTEQRKYRSRAKQLMLRARLAEYAGLEDHVRYVAKRFLNHPYILSTTRNEGVLLGTPYYGENRQVGR